MPGKKDAANCNLHTFSDVGFWPILKIAEDQETFLVEKSILRNNYIKLHQITLKPHLRIVDNSMESRGLKSSVRGGENKVCKNFYTFTYVKLFCTYNTYMYVGHSQSPKIENRIPICIFTTY